MSRFRIALVAAAAAAGAGVLLAPGHASAHPLGNLTVNTSAGIVVAADAVRVDYVLDLAELPTVQARQSIDTDGDGAASATEQAAYRTEECATLASGLDLTVDGQRVELVAAGPSVRLLPGQGGLETLRLECPLRGAIDGVGRATSVGFVDTNLTDRIGWREVTVQGDGTTIVASDVGATSTSNRLLSYPAANASPPRQLSATAEVRAGGPALVPPGTGPSSSAERPQARGADPLTSWFQRTLGDRDLTIGLAAVALLVAVVLGGLHALAPGHGKTLMAAYVVGRRGTTRQVCAIGLTVAITHTGGVLALGTAIWLSQALAPEHVLPWLTVASGGLLASCGLALLYRRVVLGRTGHQHLNLPGLPDLGQTHDHANGHGHEAHDHGRGHGRHEHAHGPHEHDHGPHDHGAHEPHGHEPHQHGHDHPHGGAHDHGRRHEHPHDEHAHTHDEHTQDQDSDVGGPPRLEPIRRSWLVLMGVAGGLVPTPSALVVLLGAVALHRTWLGVAAVALYGLGMAAALMGAGLALIRLQGWLERTWLRRPRAALAMRYLPAITALLLIGGGLSVVLRGAAQL